MAGRRSIVETIKAIPGARVASVPGVLVVCADGLEVAKRVQCDHMITDPPFSKRVHDGQRQGSKFGDAMDSRQRVQIRFDHITEGQQSALISIAETQIKRWSIIFADEQAWPGYLSAVNRSKDVRFIRKLVWHKPNGAPQFTGDRPSDHIEIAYAFASKSSKLRWNGKGSSNFFEFNTARLSKEEKANGMQRHPCLKPVELMMR